MDPSTKLLNANFRPLIRILRRNSALVDVKHVPFSIPEAIQRSSIDLLKTLSETVKEDETSMHFGLIDDPILLPTSFKDRRHYLMSKELGRRTARKIVEEWPTLFMFDRDTPELKAFRPQKPLDPELVELSEENLQKMIKDRRVPDATKFYQKMVESDIQLSQSTKFDLFRLVSYYNEGSYPLTEFEEWHTIRYFYSDKENTETKWKEGGLAEKLFSELPKTDESFSTLICALCKFPTDYSLGRARELYLEMTSAGLIPYEEVFNSLLLAQVPFNDSKTFDALHWFREMSRFGVCPSLRTFNAALSSLLHTSERGDNASELVMENPVDKTRRWKMASDMVYEMRSHGLEPTLATYSHVLKLAPSRMILAALLDEVLTQLECKLVHEQIKRTSDDDAVFFRNAMSTARLLDDEVQIDRLITIYRSENNKVLFECSDDEQWFYSDYLLFKMAVLPLDSFYILYKLYVPRLFALRNWFLHAILKTMRERKPMEFCWPLLKRVTEDVISSNCIANDKFAWKILSLLTDVKPRLFNLPDWESYMGLCRRVVDIVEQLDRQKLEKEMFKKSQ